MKKFNLNGVKPGRAILIMLGFLLISGCSKDNGNGNGNGNDNGNGNGEGTKYTLTVSKPTNGSIIGDKGGINCWGSNTVCEAEFGKGTKVTLTATADKGYELGDWSGGGCSGLEATCTVVMTIDQSMSKAFPKSAAPPTPMTKKYTLEITSPKCGTITDSDSINCGSEGNTCRAQFDEGTEVMLTATADADYTVGVWGGDCSDATCTLSMNKDKTVTKAFIASATDTDSDCVLDTNDVDDDNNGLIEIHNLDMLFDINGNLDGTSYQQVGGSISDTGAPMISTTDCKTASRGVYLCGYELMKDLDFNQDSSYASGSTKKGDWQPNNSKTGDATNQGFSCITNFNAIFEGNGYTISNLYSRSAVGLSISGNAIPVGLFQATTDRAVIRNLGVADANLYGRGSRFEDHTGSLVATNKGSIVSCHAINSSVNGGNLDYDRDTKVDSIGGLVGQNAGNIIASYAKVSVNGGDGEEYMGGLVGMNEGSIIASYATGTAHGGDKGGHASGLMNYSNVVGGLVGWNNGGTITASYATGDVDGGKDAENNVGALVGSNGGTIVASYATGNSNGGSGRGYDYSGALVGQHWGTITHSYGFGIVTNASAGGEAGTAHPGGLMGSDAAKANTLTDPAGVETTDADDVWDDASQKTKDAWDFGDNNQPPALRYADYDGDMAGTDYCALFPAEIHGTNDALTCGTSLLPGQRP